MRLYEKIAFPHGKPSPGAGQVGGGVYVSVGMSECGSMWIDVGVGVETMNFRSLSHSYI